MLPQRRVQLTAKDLQGRTVLTHAIRSGHGELFDAVLTAVRNDVLESEVTRACGQGVALLWLFFCHVDVDRVVSLP